MRTFSTLRFFLSLVTLLMLSSCTKDNAMQEAEQELDISVCDEGFGFATRAKLSGYNTTFATGDACGFFVIRGSKIIHRNVKLTRTSSGGWELEKTVRAKGSVTVKSSKINLIFKMSHRNTLAHNSPITCES